MKVRPFVAVPALLCSVLSLGLVWVIDMPLRTHRGSLHPLDSEERKIRINLESHVHELALRIGERHLLRQEELSAAAAYIENRLGDMEGCQIRIQRYVVRGREVKNIECEKPGRTRPEEIVVVGAHYDTAAGTPGANDNASGIAGLLELARIILPLEPARTVRFVAFANEELPHFMTENMGSLVYAREARRREENVTAMISLETIGCYLDEPGSQHYPFPFGLIYPDRGNFIAFVGNLASRSLVRSSIASFRRHTAFPSEGVASPGQIAGIGWSDHWSFWKEGYRAVMVTDTAPFRYPHYHTSGDMPDRIDYEKTARVVSGIARVVTELAGGGSAPPRREMKSTGNSIPTEIVAE